MPISLPIDQLQAGMTLAEPVKWNGQLLVAAGRALSGREVSVLKERVLHGTLLIRQEGLDDHVEFEDDSDDRVLADAVRGSIARVIAERIPRIVRNKGVNTPDLEAVAGRVAKAIQVIRRKRSIVVTPPPPPPRGRHLPWHAGHVTYLSLVMAHTFELYVLRERQRMTASRMDLKTLTDKQPLGVAAALADVALFAHADLFDPVRVIDDASQKLLRSHALDGYKMLPPLATPLIKALISSHHENLTGDGYPKGLTEERLHVFARILRIADHFHGEISALQGGRRHPAVALWDMIHGPGRKAFDQSILSMALGIIQPWPIGTRLKLANGQQAVVVGYNREDGLNPSVVICYDTTGRLLDPVYFEGPFFLDQRPDVVLKHPPSKAAPRTDDGEDTLVSLMFPPPRPSAAPAPVAVTPSAAERPVSRAEATARWASGGSRVTAAMPAVAAPGDRQDESRLAPMARLERWISAARAARSPSADQMMLSTTDLKGRPSARVMKLAAFTQGGLIFGTHYDSRKGREMAANPQVCAVFWWPALNRQVQIEGRVKRLESEVSDRIFRTLNRGAQLVASVSPQSRVVDGVESIRAAGQALAEKGISTNLKRPEGWGAFILVPQCIEFWAGQEDGFHDRWRHKKVNGRFGTQRLAP